MQRKPAIDGVDAFIHGAKDAKGTGTGQPADQSSKEQVISQEGEPNLDKLKRQTYYVTELYIEAIEQMAFYTSTKDQKVNKYDIVMDALKQYIPEEYVKKAREKLLEV